MRTLFRILSIVLICCVLGSFAGMVITLIKGLFSLFFIIGGFLVGFIAMSWFLGRISKSYAERHPEENETEVPKD
ncbi:MAG: hypothetical protein IKI54_05115 [Lachnospiraceae bacterium]|nr:hypothetical protein [Lachnospiraceae bacterium]